MPVSAKKLAANRANARKSKGPCTPEGKKRVSRNAVTHGLFCNDTVLPGEDAELFEQLRHAMLLELRPQDVVELMIVDRIVLAQWKLRRLNAVESAVHQANHQQHIDAAREELGRKREHREQDEIMDEDDDHPEPPARETAAQRAIDAAEANPNAVESIAIGLVERDGMLERLSRYEQRLELSIHRNLRQLEKLRKQKHKGEEAGAPPMARCPFLPSDSYDEANALIVKHAARNQKCENNPTAQPKTALAEEERINPSSPPVSSATAFAPVPGAYDTRPAGSAGEHERNRTWQKQSRSRLGLSAPAESR